jgi:exonuclease III
MSLALDADSLVGTSSRVPGMGLRMVSWNCGGRQDVWSGVLADDPDVVLLQELAPVAPPDPYRLVTPALMDDWRTVGWQDRAWRTAVAVREGVDADGYPTARLEVATSDELGVSRSGSLAAATVTVDRAEPVTIVSAYAAWETPVPHCEHGWIYADASAHRLVSDLSALVATQRGHRLVVAGDWNILRGYGEGGSKYWKRRYDTVFERMSAIGLELVGPFAGRSVDPRPDEMPADSRTTPTFWPTGGRPTRQLDFVFASSSLAETVKVSACNDESWTSDHCRIDIELG